MRSRALSSVPAGSVRLSYAAWARRATDGHPFQRSHRGSIAVGWKGLPKISRTRQACLACSSNLEAGESGVAPLARSTAKMAIAEASPSRFRIGAGDTESGVSGSGSGFGLRIGSGSNQGLGRVLRADPREFQVFVLGLRVSNSFSNFDRSVGSVRRSGGARRDGSKHTRKDAICARSGYLATWLSSQ